MKFPPNNGQGDVWAGQKVIVTLPQNALIDLSTSGANRLPDRQSPLVQWLRQLVLAYGLMKRCKTSEACRHVRMVRAQRRLPDRHGPAQFPRQDGQGPRPATPP